MNEQDYWFHLEELYYQELLIKLEKELGYE